MIAQIDKYMVRKRPFKIPGRLISYALIEGRPLTTGGQWINPLVFAGYRAAQSIRSPRRTDAPIFIVGTGRSGTTILGKLFAVHRETAFLNEPKALWHFAHGEEDIIGSYSTGPARIRLDAAEKPETMSARIARVYGWAMTWSGAQRIVDKYPELIFRTDFVDALFPHARFVAIVRDGVDTCNSVAHWSVRKGQAADAQTHDWWGRNGRKWEMIVDELVPEHADLAPLQQLLRSTDNHQDRAAVEWIVSMREVARAIAKRPDQVLRISYEDLCKDSNATLGEVCDFCDLQHDPVFFEYAETVLSKAENIRPLQLLPELVAPFCQTLHEMGYGQSVELVQSRAMT